MKYDGTVQIGLFKGADTDSIIIKAGMEILDIPLSQISLMYILDGKGGYIPYDLSDKQEYSYKGKRYLLGTKDREWKLYLTDGKKITDEKIIQEFLKINTRILELTASDLARFEKYINDINEQKKTTKIQNTAAKIRDFSAGIAVNTAVVLFEPNAGTQLMLSSMKDARMAVLKKMTDPKTYLLELNEDNLNYCKEELEKFTAEIKDYQRQQSDGTPLDIEDCLNTINRYLTIFTLYMPSMNMMRDMTAAGDWGTQTEELLKGIGEKNSRDCSR
jgi:hypothetical protein